MSEAVFKEVRYDLRSLVDNIQRGEIGLPDLQRPFVWKNSKVRDLFDSMYRGYPIGYLLLWQNAHSDDAKTIGDDTKQKAPRLLIVDGQQRLTSLYAVIRGIPVVRENYDAERIQIAFNPMQQKFEVADAAVRRDRSYIPDISKLWDPESDLFEVVDTYLEGLGEVDAEEKKRLRKAIQRLANLTTFNFTALELSSAINEEQVADVFVRINSKGQPLNQSDFILTLMSVFWDDGRRELEAFCRAARKPKVTGSSAFNHYLHPDPDHLLRVNVGVGFGRARLKHVYSILRGKDLETGEFSAERRDGQFQVLREAQNKTLKLQYWHDFFKCVLQAGYRGRRMIGSTSTLLYTYVFYLLGRTKYGVDEHTLRAIIARWLFMSLLTGRYTSSPESRMESDLLRLASVTSPEGFVGVLESVCRAVLTGDFWSITLPSELATSSAQSPSLFAYFASLNLLDAKALYSENKVVDLLDPWSQGPRSALERHHLFPKAHLTSVGINRPRETNQIANYALVEWGDNADISDKAPSVYVPKMEKRFSGKDLERMYYWHALPDGWQDMEYATFLEKRRELIAKIVKAGYELISRETAPTVEDHIDVSGLVAEGEGDGVEFKSTLRKNLHTGKPDPRIELAVLKTIAGFLNAKGGKLVVGVADDGTAVGMREDDFPNEDKMGLHLVNLIRDRLGPHTMIYVHPRFEDFEDERVLAVECLPAKSAVYVKDGNTERFYVRTSAATTELTGGQSESYIKARFG